MKYAWWGEGGRRAREEEVVGWCMLDAFYLSPFKVGTRVRLFGRFRFYSVRFGTVTVAPLVGISVVGIRFPHHVGDSEGARERRVGIGAKVRRKVQLLVNHRGEWLRVIDDSHDRRACSVSRSVRGTRELVHTTSTTVRDVQRKSKHGNACY